MAPPDGDFYAVLGVPADADAETITAAYRERAKETHPDVSDAADAADRFRRVSRAHEVLSDPVERRRYDRLGHERYCEGTGQTDEPAPGGTSSGTDRTGGSRETDREDTSSRGTERTDRTHRTATSTDGGAATASRRDAAAAAATGTEEVRTVAWGTAKWLQFAAAVFDAWQDRLTPASAAIALGVFVAYPVFLVSAVTPWFPTPVNLTVGVCTLFLVGYLVLRPEIGVPVFGVWAVLLPVALTIAGIGVLSVVGVFALVLTVVPLVVTLVTLGGTAL